MKSLVEKLFASEFKLRTAALEYAHTRTNSNLKLLRTAALVYARLADEIDDGTVCVDTADNATEPTASVMSVQQ